MRGGASQTGRLEKTEAEMSLTETERDIVMAALIQMRLVLSCQSRAPFDSSSDHKSVVGRLVKCGWFLVSFPGNLDSTKYLCHIHQRQAPCLLIRSKIN